MTKVAAPNDVDQLQAMACDLANSIEAIQEAAESCLAGVGNDDRNTSDLAARHKAGERFALEFILSLISEEKRKLNAKWGEVGGASI